MYIWPSRPSDCISTHTNLRILILSVGGSSSLMCQPGLWYQKLMRVRATLFIPYLPWAICHRWRGRMPPGGSPWRASGKTAGLHRWEGRAGCWPALTARDCPSLVPGPVTHKHTKISHSGFSNTIKERLYNKLMPDCDCSQYLITGTLSSEVHLINSDMIFNNKRLSSQKVNNGFIWCRQKKIKLMQ